MVELGNPIPLSSTSFFSSNDNTYHTSIDSSHKKSSSSKNPYSTPLSYMNIPKLPFDQNNHHAQKPIFIQVPKNYDLIEVVVQFAHRYRVNITVLSASGYLSNATIRYTYSHTPAFIVHGPFTIASLIGTYINKNLFATSSFLLSSSSNMDLHCYFTISFSSTSSQSFTGIVGGKIIAADNVVVVATVFKDFENNKIIINDGGGEEKNNNNPCACEPFGNLNISNFN
ncbi:hypothetical protein VNO78_18288 [Psophocarpus tetragonolobus]|uniref:PPC domain-containing protein n=1 Tax=Psophocarpus tetragonolobus TaxID=3891 RepID=A0AAN9XM18_PSOTE